jgi:hypothetical protein
MKEVIGIWHLRFALTDGQLGSRQPPRRDQKRDLGYIELDKVHRLHRLHPYIPRKKTRRKN